MKLHYIYLGTIMITTSFVAVAVEVHEQDEKKRHQNLAIIKAPMQRRSKISSMLLMLIRLSLPIYLLHLT